MLALLGAEAADGAHACPTGRPLLWARYAWAESSMTGMPRAAASARISSIWHGLPNRWVTTMARVRSDRHGLDGGGGDVHRVGVDVGEHRDGALVEDRAQRPHVGDRRGDDLVARLEVEAGEGDVDGGGAGGAGDDVLDAEQLGHGRLEALA